MKLAVVGSRGFNNYELMSEKIKELYPEISTIVSGGAKGADSLAERYAKENNLELIVFKAEWDKYGKSAGFKRNIIIWDNSDAGIAFWDGESKGTTHSFKIAENQKKRIEIVQY